MTKAEKELRADATQLVEKVVKLYGQKTSQRTIKEAVKDVVAATPIRQRRETSGSACAAGR